MAKKRNRDGKGKPTHIVRGAGDRFAICGEDDPLPRVLMRHAPNHRYAQPRCVVCYEGADLAEMLTEDDYARAQ